MTQPMPQPTAPANSQPNEPHVDNGVNVGALLEARAALKAQPEAAQFAFRATTRWVHGAHSRSTVQGFFGLGEEQRHRTEFSFEADHPELFAAQDNGATPVEMVLSALGSCLTAGVAAVAQHRGIQLRAVTAKLEGALDARGMLGVERDVRNGFGEIKVTYEIDADADREALESLIAQSQKRSAVFDALSNPTRITVALA